MVKKKLYDQYSKAFRSYKMDEDKNNGKTKGLLDIPFYELSKVSCKFTLNAFCC